MEGIFGPYGTNLSTRGRLARTAKSLVNEA